MRYRKRMDFGGIMLMVIMVVMGLVFAVGGFARYIMAWNSY